MRYWIYLNELVQGPFELDELIELRAFGESLPVCMEDRQEWLPAGRVADLAPSLERLRSRHIPPPPPPPPPTHPPAATPLQGELFSEPPGQKHLFEKDEPGKGPFAYAPVTDLLGEVSALYDATVTMPIRFGTATLVKPAPVVAPPERPIRTKPSPLIGESPKLVEESAKQLERENPVVNFIPSSAVIAWPVQTQQAVPVMEESVAPEPESFQASPAPVLVPRTSTDFESKLSPTKTILGIMVLILGMVGIISSGYWVLDRSSSRSAIAEANRGFKQTHIVAANTLSVESPGRRLVTSEVKNSFFKNVGRAIEHLVPFAHHREKLVSETHSSTPEVSSAPWLPVAVPIPTRAVAPAITQAGNSPVSIESTALAGTPAPVGAPTPTSTSSQAPVNLTQRPSASKLGERVKTSLRKTAKQPTVVGHVARIILQFFGMSEPIVTAPPLVATAPAVPVPATVAAQPSFRVAHRAKRTVPLPKAPLVGLVPPVVVDKAAATAKPLKPIEPVKTTAAEKMVTAKKVVLPTPAITTAPGLTAPLPNLKMNNTSDPWAGRQNEAINLAMYKKICGDNATVIGQAKVMLQEMHEKELMHAADTGERLYLPDKMAWSALREDGPLYRVYMNFSALQANGERVQARSYQFSTQLEQKKVTSDDNATLQDFLNKQTPLVFKHNPMADDIESILSAIDLLDKQKLRAMIVQKSRHNKKEQKNIQQAIDTAEAKVQRAIVYFRTKYPENKLQNLGKAYNFVPLLEG